MNRRELLAGAALLGGIRQANAFGTGRLGLGLGHGGALGGASNPPISQSLDFVNGVYKRNGVTYPDFATFLSSTGSTFTRASAGYSMDGAQSFTTNIARITSAGILLEPASTNIVFQSKFASGWSAENSTVTVNALTAPDGTTTAATVKEDATATVTHGIFQNQGSTPLTASRYVMSVFSKRTAGTRNAALMEFDSTFANSANAVIDLGSGTVSSASFAGGAWTAGVASVVVAPQSYFRCGNSFVATVTTGIWTFVRPSAISYSGDNTSTIAVWGIQIELAAASGYFLNNPSSFIATGASGATRAVDALTIAVPAGLTNALVTFDDNSTQSFTGLSGTWAVPTGTGINRPLVKSINFT